MAACSVNYVVFQPSEPQLLGTVLCQEVPGRGSEGRGPARFGFRDQVFGADASSSSNLLLGTDGDYSRYDGQECGPRGWTSGASPSSAP
jgi:hypothetical protein